MAKGNNSHRKETKKPKKEKPKPQPVRRGSRRVINCRRVRFAWHQRAHPELGASIL